MAEAIIAEPRAVRLSPRAWIEKSRGTLVAIAVLFVAVVVFELISPKPFSYFDLSTVTGTAGGLALAGIGETIVVIAGGLDLSVGAVIALVNVLLVTLIGDSKMSDRSSTLLMATVLSLGVGGLVGAINGFLVGYLRMQAIVVTLATMFIVQGLVLLIKPIPGGEVSNDFSMILVGDIIPNVLPAPIIVMALGDPGLAVPQAHAIWGRAVRGRQRSGLGRRQSCRRASHANAVLRRGRNVLRLGRNVSHRQHWRR